MGVDFQRGVLASSRVTGMLARLVLGENYDNTPMMLGPARELRAWESSGPAAG